MWIGSRTLLPGLAFAAAVSFAPQAPLAAPAWPSAPVEAGPYSAAIVKRAAAFIATPAQWNRADTGDCAGASKAKTLSITCALQLALDTAATNQPAHSDCRFHPAGNGQEGTCGAFYDEAPIFTIAPVASIASGAWRAGANPTAVWAGTMSDAGSPVMVEARQAVGLVAATKYGRARLVAYNNDPATTFDDLQKFFRLVEDRVIAYGAADLPQSTDDVEIEIYDGGRGVMRTYTGWFPVSGFVTTGGAIRFQLDGKDEVPANATDRAILVRAAALLTSDAVWNRADDRKCPADAKTWSIYCAVERAQIEVAGGFHHRRPAGELVRVIVDERTKDRDYSHRMMDYNNDPSTRLADVQSLFAEAIARIK